MTIDKLDLRDLMRLKRAAVSPIEREKAGLALAENVAELACIEASHHIACYMSLSSEIDTSPLINYLLSQHKWIYLPVLKENGTLDFHHYSGRADDLHPNRYQILEPHPGTPSIPPSKLDLVFVPLVAFDKAGHRLGMGKGYYDKTFAFKKSHEKPHLIGLAYHFQEVTMVPHDAWDIPLDGVVTEEMLDEKLGLSSQAL